MNISNSGYDFDYRERDLEKSKMDIVKDPIPTDLENERFSLYYNTKKCPKCLGKKLQRYMDGSTNEYILECANVPRQITAELKCVVNGERYEIKQTKKNAGLVLPDPKSWSCKSVKEYVDKIQPDLCRWAIRISHVDKQ